MQKIKRIINLDVFHFSFEEELNNYMRGFLIKDHKLHCDGHINLTKTSSGIHSAEITKMKDNFGYL